MRSVRDKAITYFSEVIEDQDKDFNSLYKAVNKFGDQVKRVAEEDRKNLEASGLKFNLFAIVGGQLEEDEQPKLYLLYPQGNWIATVVLKKDQFNILEHRFHERDLGHIADFWSTQLSSAIDKLPADALNTAFSHDQAKDMMTSDAP